MIIPSKLSAASAMSGFKNYLSSACSVSVPAQNLPAGGFVAYVASTPLNNTNSVSQVQIQYTGLSTQWFVLYGSLTTSWNNNAYQIETFYYFNSSTLFIYTIISNQTAGTVFVPAFTVNCNAFLFIAPF